MVGRTPEYLGKKIEQYEVKMAMLAVLVLAADILCFTALWRQPEPAAAAKTRQTFTDKQRPTRRSCWQVCAGAAGTTSTTAARATTTARPTTT